MKDFLSDFLDAMSKNGYAPLNPSEIKADDRLRSYTLASGKTKNKHGKYRLCIESDFAFGYYGDWREDGFVNYSSFNKTVLNRQEKEELKKRIEQSRLKSEREEKDRQEKAAQQASSDILFLSEASADHPYIKRKKITPSGILQSGDDLIIPMCIEGKVWNYQTIKPDGFKMFLSGALVNGTSFVLDGDESLVYICEGVATGKTIREITGNKVYVAFNAGNLVNVAEGLKGKYEAILIAADNDHETKVREKPYNTGIEKAKLIKKEHGVDYVYPEFKDGAGLSDFNDLFCAEGHDVTKGFLTSKNNVKISTEGVNKISRSSQDVVGAAPSTPSLDDKNSESWRDLLRMTKNGIDRKSTTNTILVMEHDDEIQGVYRYDSFSKKILLAKCPPWESDTDFKVRPIADHDYIDLECFLETKWNLLCSKNKCADLIESVSKLKQNTFNPASDYFDSLQWDGVSRLDNWLHDHVAKDNQNKEYLSFVGRKFMTALAARAMNAGCKFDSMIILEGAQNAGKSFLSRLIGTVGDEEYFLDDFKDIDNKDALMKMQGKLIVELAEINTMRKADVNDLKAFLSRQVDVFRPPYGRNTMESPRQCVFIGTVNPEGEYLRDVTGNRRFWPVFCRDKIDIDSLKSIMPQLHAEAAYLYKNGEDLFLNDEQYEIAKQEQESRIVHDLWSDKIEKAIRGKERVSKDEVCEALHIETEKRTPMVNIRLNQIMTKLGYESQRYRENSYLGDDNRVYGFVKKSVD